jgi:uncharacterized membrane protein (UPF0127 family)
MQFPQFATLHTGPGGRDTNALVLRVASSLWSRFRGLMLAAPLTSSPCTQGLLITRCPSVHGFLMRYSIDVVYLSRAHQGSDQDAQHYSVTDTSTLRPWRISVGRSFVMPLNATPRSDTAIGVRPQRSLHALELPAGSIARMRIVPGDVLTLHSQGSQP